MRFVDPFTQNRKFPLLARGVTFLALSLQLISTCSGNAWAQATISPAQPPSSATPSAINPGPQWGTLSPTQRAILQPLANIWNSLTLERKNKWLALAQKYPNLAPAEQAKLQSRMAEWAVLNPQERERARLNFAETKKLSPSERTADWEAYQALSPEERQKFAEKARPKPAGAAIAPKPVPPNTLTVVPVTRRTTEQNPSAAAAKPVLDRNTLLPVVPRPAPAVSAPASPTRN